MTRAFGTVLFDLDGTLVDSTRLILQAYHHTLAAHGRPAVADRVLMGRFGIPLRENLEQLTDGPSDVDAMLETYTAYNVAHHDDLVRAFPGVVDAVRVLHARGKRLAVVTGKRGAFAQRGLDVSGLAPYFAEVLGPERYAAPKPHADPVQAGLRAVGGEAADAVYVGDSPHDVGAAHAAGVAAAVVRWGPLPPDMFPAAPDLWIETPDDLARL